MGTAEPVHLANGVLRVALHLSQRRLRSRLRLALRRKRVELGSYVSWQRFLAELAAEDSLDAEANNSAEVRGEGVEPGVRVPQSPCN